MTDTTPGKGESMERFNSRIAGLSYFAALLLIGTVIIYPIAAGRLSNETLNNMALTALGAAIMVVSKGGDWFMRGRVTAPTTGDSTDTDSGTSTTVKVPLSSGSDGNGSGSVTVTTGATPPPPRPTTPPPSTIG